MKRKNRLIYLLLLLAIVNGYAQSPDTVMVYKGHIKVWGSNIKTFAFAKGDMVILTYKVEEDKNIDEVKVYTADSVKTLFVSDNNPKKAQFQYQMRDDEVLNFYFLQKGLVSRMVDIEISRVPESDALIFWEPSVQTITHTDVVQLKYTKDTLTKIVEEVIDKEIQIFDRYVMEEVPMITESNQLKSIVTDDRDRIYTITLPPPPVNDAKLKYISYSINSKIGGAKHWAIADIGGTIAGVLLEPFTGPLGGMAINAMMQSMGPQPGGEPVLMVIENKKWQISGSDLLGSLTGTSQIKFPDDFNPTFMTSITNMQMMRPYFPDTDKFIYLLNMDIAKAKNVRVDVSAIYYAPIYNKVIAKEKIFTPLIEKTTVDGIFRESYEKIVPRQTIQ